MVTGTALMLAALPLLAVVSTPWLLGATLLIFGAIIWAMVPAIATMGYTGVLLGPALTGLVAHGSTLTVAFLLVAAAVGAAIRIR